MEKKAGASEEEAGRRKEAMAGWGAEGMEWRAPTYGPLSASGGGVGGGGGIQVPPATK